MIILERQGSTPEQIELELFSEKLDNRFFKGMEREYTQVDAFHPVDLTPLIDQILDNVEFLFQAFPHLSQELERFKWVLSSEDDDQTMMGQFLVEIEKYLTDNEKYHVDVVQRVFLNSFTATIEGIQQFKQKPIFFEDTWQQWMTEDLQLKEGQNNPFTQMAYLSLMFVVEKMLMRSKELSEDITFIYGPVGTFTYDVYYLSIGGIRYAHFQEKLMDFQPNDNLLTFFEKLTDEEHYKGLKYIVQACRDMRLPNFDEKLIRPIQSKEGQLTFEGMVRYALSLMKEEIDDREEYIHILRGDNQSLTENATIVKEQYEKDIHRERQKTKEFNRLQKENKRLNKVVGKLQADIQKLTDKGEE